MLRISKWAHPPLRRTEYSSAQHSTTNIAVAGFAGRSRQLWRWHVPATLWECTFG